MSPLSRDPRRRRRQLANLRPRTSSELVGNRNAVKHGAFARLAHDRLDAKEREVFDALALDAPMRDPDGGLPADSAVAVKLLADVLLRLDDVKGYLRDHGIVDPKKKELRESAIALESRLRNEAKDHAEALAMGPRAKVRLGIELTELTRSIDLSTAMSEPDDARRAELLQRAGIEADADEDGDDG